MFDFWKHCNAAHAHVKVLFFSLFYLEGEREEGIGEGGKREGGKEVTREGGWERGRVREE